MEVKHITVCGLKTEYIDIGEGTPVLLLHGWLTNKESMAPIYQHLAKNHRCIALDLPGFGNTEEQKEPWDAAQYAAFTEAFMKAVQIEKPVGIGHSNGGRILLKLCSHKSHLFSKLLLVDAAGIKNKHSLSWYVRVYTYKAGKKILSLPLLRRTGLLEKLQKNAGSSDYRNSSPVLKATMTKLVEEDLRHEIKNISIPTLLVWGEKDTATPLSDAYVMEKAIADAGVAVIPGAGHFSYLDGYGQFQRILDSYL